MRTRAWKCRSVSARAVAVLGAVASCANGTTTFQSSTNLKNSAPVTRLVVFESVQGPYFVGDFYRGFVEGLKSQLTSCGVMPAIEQIDPLDLDTEQHIASAIESFHASSVMLVSRTSGDNHTFSNGFDTHELRFTLKLLDIASNKVTSGWPSRSSPC